MKKFFYTRVGYTIIYTGITLAVNLITRAIWWPEAELLGWNVPISVLLGMIVAQPLYSVAMWMKRRHEAQISVLTERHKAIVAELEEWRNALHRDDEAIRLIDEFLNDPETGIARSRQDRTRRSPGVHKWASDTTIEVEK